MMQAKITIPAFLEYRNDAGEDDWAPFDKIAASPGLHGRLRPGSKRKFRNAIDKLRKHGMLSEIPYIGPPDGR